MQYNSIFYHKMDMSLSEMSSMTTTLDVEEYMKMKTKFTEYPPDLVSYCSNENIPLPAIESHRGQGLALMAQPDIRGKQHIDRAGASAFLAQIGMNCSDSIQAFNKAIGLKRIKMRGAYCLCYPYQKDMTDINKRKGCTISGDRNEQIEKIKEYWRTILTDVPNEDWQIGHLDPTIDSSDSNLAFQPPIQGKYRNRFKWDLWFQRMWPTGDELIKNMDDYYTETEQRQMLEYLTNKLN